MLLTLHFVGVYAEVFFSKRFWRDKKIFVQINVLSRVHLFATPWTAAHQALLSMEYWSGWPFSPLGDLPNPGIEPTSLMFPPMAGRFFPTNANQEVGGKKNKNFF